MLNSLISLMALAGPWTAARATTFVDASATMIPMAITNGATMDMEFADLDGDGWSDLVLAAEFGQNAILFFREGRYVHGVEALPQDVLHDSEDIAIADLDGDGDPDLVFASEDDQRNEVYLNDGQGSFSDATDRLPVTGTSNSVAAFDANGDGHVDLLFGNNGRNELVLNDGEARFTLAAEAFPAAVDITQDIELGDLDGDGDLDVVLANENANRILRNEGDGTFADVTEQALGWRQEEETREADLADVDGDGDLDLYFANVGWAGHNPQDALLLNDGQGRFTPAPEGALPAFADFSLDVDFADLDGDGDLDAITARLAPSLGQPVNLLLNDGTGRFRLANELIPEASVGLGVDVEVADFDHDGLPDIYVTNFRPGDRLLLGSR
ncbi:MAG: VCBS repeat-containing protein [Planctomycetota bacterium]